MLGLFSCWTVFSGLSTAFQTSYRLNMGSLLHRPKTTPLDVLWAVDTPYLNRRKHLLAPSVNPKTVGFAMMFGAFVGLGAMAVKWRKRPQDWQKTNSFSSWLLPVHAGDSTFMSSKLLCHRKKARCYLPNMGLGRYISIAELNRFQLRIGIQMQS
ncbi:hypothetical protein Leryth_019019 [Lithospermum erythrorhizon]|nr:hypothetical protein Leryth_019019 [Lithospermum erythrorhizon]